MEKSNTSRQNHWQLYSIILACVAIVIAIVGLAGWFFHSYALRSAFGSGGTMKVNTGICLLAAGLAIISFRFKSPNFTRLLALFVLLLGQLTLLEYSLNQNLGIDQLFYSDLDTNSAVEPPGRMSLLTACNLVALSIALLALTFKQFSLAQLFTAFLFIVAYASFLGHLFNISHFYQFGRFSTISGHTAFSLMALNLSVLLYCANSGWMQIFLSPFMGGKLARTSFLYFLITVPAFMGFYLYASNQYQFTPASSLVSSFLAICLITLPIAYIFLQRLDNLDAALQQANQNLQQTNDNLAHRNQELTNINQGLDDVVYMASHDFKGAISNLEAIFEELKQVGTTYLPPDDQQLIYFGANSVNNLKKTILDLTQIIRSQQMHPGALEPILLTPLLQEIQQELDREISATNACLQVQLLIETVFFSRIHLRSILANLISNAIKYRLTDRPPVILIRAEAIPGGVQIQVTDNGLGLTEVQQSKLFTIFKRFHSHIEGSGIGLYLVKRTLENYGGRIEVNSKVNVGSCFTVFIPQPA